MPNNKYRVFELAKEFGAPSKVILDILARNNMPVKNHMSSVDDSGRELLVRTFARKSDAPPAAEGTTKAPAPKPPKVLPAEKPNPAASQAQPKNYADIKTPVRPAATMHAPARGQIARKAYVPVTKTPPERRDGELFKPKAEQRSQQPLRSAPNRQFPGRPVTKPPGATRLPLC